MDLIETGKTAASSLAGNKLRSILMLLGMIIGVAAVIIVVAIGTVGQRKVEKELETFGINSIWMWRDSEDRKSANENTLSSGNEISNEDIKAISLQYSDLIHNATPNYVIFKDVNFGKKTREIELVGTTPNFQSANNEKLSSGRFLTEIDIAFQRRVAVLSSETKKEFYEGINPVGRFIRINDEKFKIIGALEKKDRAFLELINSVGGQMGRNIYIPISILQCWDKTKNISYFQAQVIPKKSEWVLEQLKETLGRRHRFKSKFKTESMQQYLETSNKILGILSLIFGIIAGISLLVGGLGIMNIMLLSVTERTREIGIRKAIGATENNIILQFLVESVLISLIGGTIGIILGLLGVFVASALSGVGNVFSFASVVIAFGTSVIVGILAGLYPANQAAEMNPIEALRYE